MATLAQMSIPSGAPGPMEFSIFDKLTRLFQPSGLVITNDSWQHRHHAAMRNNDAANGETHFSVQMVSEAFRGKNTLQRHRMVNAALADEFKGALHALSLITKTPEELPKDA
ncbi:bola-like protein [Thelephora ganbajun]|uniref:Bola-like protein n=1 Tax=Thelephora ganbajun TaxID=370292 RepID=A0ACB6ZVQ6_THEGA|nr:bola-like protein [Thelephora ganbajun]